MPRRTRPPRRRTSRRAGARRRPPHNRPRRCDAGPARAAAVAVRGAAGGARARERRADDVRPRRRSARRSRASAVAPARARCGQPYAPPGAVATRQRRGPAPSPYQPPQPMQPMPMPQPMQPPMAYQPQPMQPLPQSTPPYLGVADRGARGPADRAVEGQPAPDDVRVGRRRCSLAFVTPVLDRADAASTGTRSSTATASTKLPPLIMAAVGLLSIVLARDPDVAGAARPDRRRARPRRHLRPDRSSPSTAALAVARPARRRARC